MEFELVKFLGPIAGTAAAAFILGVFAGSSNFPVDGLDEVVVWKAIALQLVEPMKNIMGVHMSLEFS